MRYRFGAKFTGTWSRDMREGHGLVMFNKGSFFEGHFVNDAAVGYGILVLVNSIPVAKRTSVAVADSHSIFDSVTGFEHFSTYKLRSCDIVWISKTAEYLRHAFPK